VLRGEKCNVTARGLLAHIDELRVFMSNSKINILSFNETKLDATIEDSEVYLPGFEIARKDRKVNGRNGGGVCIYVQCNLNCKIRDDLCTENLECLVLEITKPRSRLFLVSTWYRLSDSPMSLFNDLQELVNKNISF